MLEKLGLEMVRFVDFRSSDRRWTTGIRMWENWLPLTYYKRTQRLSSGSIPFLSTLRVLPGESRTVLEVEHQVCLINRALPSEALNSDFRPL